MLQAGGRAIEWGWCGLQLAGGRSLGYFFPLYILRGESPRSGYCVWYMP